MSPTKKSRTHPYSKKEKQKYLDYLMEKKDMLIGDVWNFFLAKDGKCPDQKTLRRWKKSLWTDDLSPSPDISSDELDSRSCSVETNTPEQSGAPSTCDPPESEPTHLPLFLQLLEIQIAHDQHSANSKEKCSSNSTNSPAKCSRQ